MITLLLIATAWSAELRVCDVQADPTCYATIQQAVDAAADEDELLIEGGTWAESVVVRAKRLSLRTVPGELAALVGDGSTDAVLRVEQGAALYASDLVLFSQVARPVEVHDASLTLHDASLAGGSLQTHGGILYADGASVRLERCTLVEGLALYEGGQIWVSDTDLTLYGASLEEGRSLGRGGSVWFEDDRGVHSLYIQSSSFFRNHADDSGGAVAISGVGSLSLFASSFEENRADQGGGLWIDPSGVLASGLVRGCSFTANLALTQGGGALLSSRVSSVRSDYCGNRAGRGAALRVQGAEDLAVSNGRFLDNKATSSGAIHVQVDDGATSVRHNHFLGNSAAEVSAFMASWPEEGPGEGSLVVRDNLFAYNTATQTVDGWALKIDLDGGEHTLASNLWWSNEPASRPISRVESGGVLGDPMVLSYSADGLCSAEEGLLSWYGAARDAGTSTEEDPDGTRADIGAFGGPDAEEILWIDTDQDGYPDLYDCETTDPDIHPEAQELWYDSIDQDCDQSSDWDQDGDGVEWDPDGSGDCDDTDPDTYPGAVERPYDGVDQDCDGLELWDADGDGYDVFEDCNDSDPSIHPGAGDADPLVDRNCDGWTDAVSPLEPRRALDCDHGPSRLAWTWLLVVLPLFLKRRRLEVG